MGQAQQQRIVSASRDISARAEAIFELIANPAEQPRWDGNNNLRHAEAGQRVRAVGDVFTMRLTRGGIRENTVVEFDEGRLIAWRPNVPGREPPGHLWRWELEPIGKDTTRTTHTYDWTELKDRSRFPVHGQLLRRGWPRHWRSSPGSRKRVGRQEPETDPSP